MGRNTAGKGTLSLWLVRHDEKNGEPGGGGICTGGIGRQGKTAEEKVFLVPVAEGRLSLRALA